MSVNPPPIKVQWPVLPSSLMYPRIILVGSPWSAPTPQPNASKIRILSCWRVSDPRASNRAPLAKAAKESTDFFNATAAKDNDEAIEKIRASGKTEIHVLTEAEKKAWINKLMPA